jgi:NADP-dependent 3-hydroxy acid dehydrogenase YdfG
MQNNLANKWVLITGASSGFGAATAFSFASQGCHLLLGARRTQRLAEVSKQAQALGAASAHYHSLDVSSTESVETFAAWSRSLTPRLNFLINNAGGAQGLDPVISGKDPDWEAMFQSNALGILRVTRAILPSMPHHAGSMIINIGSVAGHTAYEGGSAYCGCKAAELQITRALRLELCNVGIRVGTVDPGMAETEFSLVRFKGDADRAKQVYQGVKPLSAEDVAETIVWVAGRPAHVCIDELIIKCTAQAEVYKVFRQPTPSS